MTYSSLESEYLISLLRSAIKQETSQKPPKGLKWERLVEMSKTQQVYSIIVPVIDLSAVPPEFAAELQLYSQNELLRALAMKSELEEIEKDLEKEQIKYMLLKGSVIRNYYPQQKMRQMSDFDILYDISDRNKLLKIMADNGYELKSDGGNSDDFMKAPYYTFEFHHALFKDVYGFCPDFSFVWDRAKPDKKIPCRYTMSCEDLYIHSIAHMYKHYIFGGFGIRFLIDTYLILKKESDKWDRKYIDNKLKEMKLYDFENDIAELSVSLIDDRALNKRQIDFFNSVICFGIYGNSKTNVDAVYKRFIDENESSSVIKYSFHRLFPSKNQMKSEYVILEEKPFLLPLYYFKRLFDKMSTGGKKGIKEIKTIKKINKDNKKQR